MGKSDDIKISLNLGIMGGFIKNFDIWQCRKVMEIWGWYRKFKIQREKWNELEFFSGETFNVFTSCNEEICCIDFSHFESDELPSRFSIDYREVCGSWKKVKPHGSFDRHSILSWTFSSDDVESSGKKSTFNTHVVEWAVMEVGWKVNECNLTSCRVSVSVSFSRQFVWQKISQHEMKGKKHLKKLWENRKTRDGV